MSIEEKISKYKKTLDLFPNPQEKYQYLIEQAKKSEEFPVELRVDEFKVNGCQSQVWLVPEEKDDKLFFKSDSDALIAKGLVTLITSIYSNETAKDITNSKIDLMDEFELGVLLSPARRNGAFSMLKIKSIYLKVEIIFIKRSGTYIFKIKFWRSCFIECFSNMYSVLF